jgi:hypothetical protein
MEKNNYVSGSSSRALTPAHLERIGQAAEPVIMVDAAFTPQNSIKESTGPVERSKGLLLRLIPSTIICGGVSWAVSGVLALNSPTAFLIFFGLMFLWYKSMDDNERWDSATGVEHHRIDAAERLADTKMAHDARLKEKVMNAYLKQLGGGDDPKITG